MGRKLDSATVCCLLNRVLIKGRAIGSADGADVGMKDEDRVIRGSSNC